MMNQTTYVRKFNVLNQDFAQEVQHLKTKHVYWASSRRECLMILYMRQIHRPQNSGFIKGQLYLLIFFLIWLTLKDVNVFLYSTWNDWFVQHILEISNPGEGNMRSTLMFYCACSVDRILCQPCKNLTSMSFNSFNAIIRW